MSVDSIRGAEPLRALVAFADELRAAGLRVSVEQLEVLSGGLARLDATRRAHLYGACRAALLGRRQDLATFDEVFARFWEGNEVGPMRAPRRMPVAPRHEPRFRSALTTLLAQRARASDPEVSVRDRSHAASEEELLRQKDFSKLSEAEALALRRLMARRAFGFAERVTRRRVAHRSRGRLDVRRAASLAARRGGVLFELPKRVAKIKPRPLVVLVDISGSMELYARVLLQFFHALRQRHAQLETFLFATRLSRVTGQLALRNVDQALEQVSRHVVDFASGTRIGESLRLFNRRWARQIVGRGAVVLLVSDGWETGSVELLEQEMRVLKDTCYRLIWLNPRLGQAAYEPRVRGMAAALNHVDDFLPCHNLQSLEALAQRLASLPRGRGRDVGAQEARALLPKREAA